MLQTFVVYPVRPPDPALRMIRPWSEARHLIPRKGKGKLLRQFDGRTAPVHANPQRSPARSSKPVAWHIHAQAENAPPDTSAASQGRHDRDFVVAGVTDIQILDEVFTTVKNAADSWDRTAFGEEFKAIRDKCGFFKVEPQKWGA